MTLSQDLAAGMPEQEAAPAGAPQPYGFWATALLSLLVIGLYFGASTLAAVILVVGDEANHAAISSAQFDPQSLPSYGFAMLSALVIAGILCTGLVALFATLRQGWSVRSYLALEPVSWRTLAAWSGITIGFLLLYHAASLVIKPQNTAGMYLALYDSARYPWLFWLAIVGAAPLFEEVLFRGFMFRGLAASRLGTWGAIVITALTWSVIHAQYELKLVAVLFILGVLFGIARARHGTVTLTIALHMLFNLIAGLEIVFLASAA